MRAAAVGKPVIVTETGIPDNDDSRRELWATSYLKAVGPLWQRVSSRRRLAGLSGPVASPSSTF
jgi:hypothetical protein